MNEILWILVLTCRTAGSLNYDVSDYKSYMVYESSNAATEENLAPCQWEIGREVYEVKVKAKYQIIQKAPVLRRKKEGG